jgi:hypothetical protein
VWETGQTVKIELKTGFLGSQRRLEGLFHGFPEFWSSCGKLLHDMKRGKHISAGRWQGMPARDGLASASPEREWAMGVVPEKINERLQFYQDHIARWADHAEAIGTTPEAVEALETLTQAAREAYRAQQVAQDAARSATEAMHLAMDAMHQAGTAIIAQVRAKAKTTGPDVYPLAGIPSRKNPSPVGQPGVPYQFEVTLAANGELHIRWKCDHPEGCKGVQYEVKRRVGLGEFAPLLFTGKRKFVDAVLPEGATHLTYQVRARRSTGNGPWAQFNVHFGTDGAPFDMTEETAAVAA